MLRIDGLLALMRGCLPPPPARDEALAWTRPADGQVQAAPHAPDGAVLGTPAPGQNHLGMDADGHWSWNGQELT